MGKPTLHSGQQSEELQANATRDRSSVTSEWSKPEGAITMLPVQNYPNKPPGATYSAFYSAAGTYDYLMSGQGAEFD